ncbi:hypothetical protein MMC10_002817 [Thelotrema lepadinum]|nr:hypothetical protein [Thelotrema lepadinum]
MALVVVATSQGTFPYVLSLFLCVYLALIRCLRFRRARQHTEIFRKDVENNSTNLTIPAAQEIYRSLFNAEFPLLFEKGIQLALFRTYAIPTISSLLDRTKLLSSSRTVPQRYSETWALFNEFALRDWESAAWVQGVARTRAIHSSYRKSGKIREEDMLYTLAVVATQPVKLIQTWEWRKLTEIELNAVGTLYRGIAGALGIDYESIFRQSLQGNMEKGSDDPRSDSQQNGSPKLASGLRSTGLDFFNALQVWLDSYEFRAMRHAPANHNLAEAGIELLLWGVPGKQLKKIATIVLTVLMEPQLRSAVGYPAPSIGLRMITVACLETRRFILRYLSLPRPGFLRIAPTRDVVYTESSGFKKTTLTSYVAAPYFVVPTMWNRWGPGAWWWWCLGLPLPGDDDEHFEPKGYLIPDIGPGLGKTQKV